MSKIQNERKAKLEILADYISKKLENGSEVNLIFICVQNSRRSHLAQVIAQHQAFLNNIKNIHCYSGGVEVTRIHPNTLKTLEKLNYKIYQKSGGENPVYELFYDSQQPPILLYSKAFEEVTKQLKEFAAVMVCSETETNCPYVPEAEKKILIPYDDPKSADASANPLEKYLSVAHQIESEMKYVFSNIK
ncbi:MAG: protein-tyrosine-phosphatase [Bacteroidota bacterium]